MLPKRFWDKVTKTENCWVWTAGVNPQGYGIFNTGKRDNGSKICSLAHRVSFKDAHGYLPQQLDHVCSNKRCVRPDHLQPLDGHAHGRKSRAVQLGDQALEYWAQNRCAYGHDKTMRKDGRYYCNVCHAKRQRVYRQKQVVQIIWGVDPASKKIAMFTDDDGLVRAHLIEVRKSDRNTELMSLRAQMEDVLLHDRAPIIYCEEPVLAGVRNIRTTILIAETVGMILSLNAEVRVVPVSSWKKATVGKGNATKDEVTEWLKEEHPGYASYCRDTQQRESQDLRDAAAIFIYGRAVEVG